MFTTISLIFSISKRDFKTFSAICVSSSLLKFLSELPLLPILNVEPALGECLREVLADGSSCGRLFSSAQFACD
jgi:hypothetical protein